MPPYNPNPPVRLMPLDFAPFETALHAFSAKRRTELDALVSTKPITTLQSMMADHQLTSVELTLWYLWRIRAYDGQLNSFISLNPDALTIAQQLDDARTAGQVRGEMHGIPIALKDNIATHDAMPNTAGAYSLRDAFADRDAFLVQKLRQAGAVILGKLNLSEWARFMSNAQPNGFSALGGQTINPYGNQFDTCGSSSGSAVAVAAGLVPVSIGSETSGSIICPASHNAVYGLKPSLGLISRDKIIPITDAQDTAGVMAIHASDLSVVMNVVKGVDDNDSLTHAAMTDAVYPTILSTDGLKGKRVGVVMPPTEEQVNAEPDVKEEDRVAFIAKLPELNAAMQAVIARLQFAGADTLILTATIELPLSLTVLEYGLREGVNAYLKGIGSALTLADIIAFNNQDPQTRIPYGQDLLEASQNNPLSPDEYATLVTTNRQLGRDTLDKIMDAHHIDFILSRGSELSTVAAMAGYPLLSVPSGYMTDGEPWGITFLGKYLSEGDLILAGYAYEKAGKPLRREPILTVL